MVDSVLEAISQDVFRSLKLERWSRLAIAPSKGQ
jgi:hypothetical protein